jgi:lipoprotein-anchoring transpeptidase ErfK/SrfK
MLRRVVTGAASLIAVLAVAAGVANAAPRVNAHAVKASAILYLPDAYFVGRQPVIVPHRTLHVGGVVHPYIPGQWVSVQAKIGNHVFKSDRLSIKPSAKHTYGRFTEALTTTGSGTVTVTATHAGTTAMLGFRAQRSYSVLNDNVGFGSTGAMVQLIQQRLAALHFYIPQTGVYDQGTGLAIDAYHRLMHWGTYQTVDNATITYLLNGWGQFKVRFPNHGMHAEGDLTDQLLGLIDGSRVEYIFPISSGKPSTPTILGDFHVYDRVPGYLPDGMYYSDFFISGYAIHGYDPAPDYPASHGCMRLPIVDAIFVYNWLNYGDWVDTYY